MAEQGHRFHDMGGQPAGPCARDEHEYEHWEKRIDAMMMLLTKAGLFRVDQTRRVLEDIGPAVLDMAYYERWMHSITHLMVERGVLSIDEIGRMMAASEKRDGNR